MNDGNWKREVSDEVKVFIRWIISSLLDASFLIVWIYLQWLVDKFTDRFPLDNIDEVQLSIFRILFAITTLAPIIFYIIRDISVMYIRTRQKIRDIRKAEEDEVHKS